jgi:putrescine transport system substrate-binding protein
MRRLRESCARCGSRAPVELLTLLLAACGQPHGSFEPAAQDQVVNVYNWFDYIKPELLQEFTAQSGISVRYDVFDSNNTLQSKLLTGHTGYDVVFPSGAYLNAMIPAGVFLQLDRGRLPNFVNLDPQLMRRLAAQDPGNEHAVIYTWGITGFAYDVAKIRARLPGDSAGALRERTDSWSMLFDPELAARFADCGIGLYESPNVIVPSVLAWLGEQPNSEDLNVLRKAQNALLAARPNIRKISTGSLVDDLASGELCLIIASNGDAMQAQERRRIAGNPGEIRFVVPREGAVLWFDVAAIPADAPHPRNALRFINFLLDPRVAAQNSRAIHFPNGNRAAQPQMPAELANAAIFPKEGSGPPLIPELAKSEEYVRARTRVWTRFRTGQ